MSIAVLTQVYDEARRLAIAGSILAHGDFRLKKLAPPLEAAAAKAPVFGKVAESIHKLVESDQQSSAEALLELSTLVSAVLYTQGETGLAGDMAPIETTDLGLTVTATSARLLKPLIDALTNTGGGREEIIRDAFERGAFNDLRVVRLAVAALDDTYPPIAEYIADKVLPIYGAAIYDHVRAGYDPKGKAGAVRRLKLLHHLDAQRARELVEQALESGSSDVKVAAIGCLAGDEESLPFLLEQAKAKNMEVRRVALATLATFEHEAATASLVRAISGKDLELVASSVATNRSPQLLKFLLEEVETQKQLLLTSNDSDELKKAVPRFCKLLDCFTLRSDEQTVEMLKMLFSYSDRFSALQNDLHGHSIVCAVATLIIQCGDPSAQRMLIDSYATLAPEIVGLAILAAFVTQDPSEVYNKLSKYYLAAPVKKKKDLNENLRVVVRQSLLGFAGGRQYDRKLFFDFPGGVLTIGDEAKAPELDRRWLDAAITQEDKQVIKALARPGSKTLEKFLSSALDKSITKTEIGDEAWWLMEVAVNTEHPRLVDHVLAMLPKLNSQKHRYQTAWLISLIRELPKSAAPRIEAILPSLSGLQMDLVTSALSELMAKAE